MNNPTVVKNMRLVTGVFLMLLMSSANADVIELSNGKKIEGNYIGREGDSINFDADGVTMTINAADVKNISMGSVVPVSNNADSEAVAHDDSLPNNTGWFVGGGLGKVSLTIIPRNQINQQETNTTTNVISAIGGYNFTKIFGIEFDLSVTTDLIDQSTQLDAYIVGTSFTPIVKLPINDVFRLYFKAGIQLLSYEQVTDSNIEDNISWQGIDPVFGAGLEANITKNVSLRFDYKYANMTLERREETTVSALNNEELDLSYSTFIISAHYQF